MNGMKQGLIFGAFFGLFFGFMLGRFGLQMNQKQQVALNQAGSRGASAQVRGRRTAKQPTRQREVKRAGKVGAKAVGKVTRYKIPVGNSPTKGPKDALITIVEFSDFECPFCNRGANTVDKIVKAYGNRVRVVFKNLPLYFHKNAKPAAEAALAANAQGKFWAFHDKLFANYRSLNKANYLKWAKELGLDMAKFKKDIESGKYRKVVEADMKIASRVGANGTPNFFINGRQLVGAQPFFRFKSLIDAELGNAKALMAKGVAASKVYDKLMEGALARKAARRRPARRRAARRVAAKAASYKYVPVGNSPTLGPKTAPITIVEFSDFQCPFCTRGANTLKQVKKAYGNKVRIVFKNYPLSFHRQAHKAAQAALAAREQGKFWEYHDKLFKNYRSLGPAKFVQFAKELGLDMAKFKAALDSGKYKAAVNADMALASRLGVRGTPNFFVNGRLISGAYPFSHFKSIIDVELPRAQAALKAGTPADKLYKKLTQSAPKPSAPAVKLSGKSNPKDAYPTYGPANAKVTIEEFSDFECPFCSRGARVIDQVKKAYGNKVRIVFKHLPLSFHKNAHKAAQAAMAAHAQGKFWAFHDKLFANSRNLGRSQYIRFAKELGLDVAKFTRELDSNKYRSAVDKSITEARRRGVRGTPNFFINGERLVGAQPFAKFKAVIDRKLGGKAAPAPAPAVAAKGTSWGPANAKVTITEYSDFECPFCSRGASVIDQIKKAYGNKVRIVFKNLPLSFHKNANSAAQAALAAGAQGKFWPFHDKLFQNQRSLGRAKYLEIAKQLGLDMAKFTKDIDSGKYKGRVDADAAEAGRRGANGTPTFFVNNRKIVGAQPFAKFKAAIDQELTGKKPAPAPKLNLAGAPSFGPANAKVTVVEFSDFECPFCNRGAKVVDQIKKEYGNKVRVVFKNLPLSFHRNAHLAAQAALAAHAQGKFWPYHDKLFANYRSLNKANFLKWAKELGLDVAKFKSALDNGTYKARVDADAAQAASVGANGTPTFLVNGQKIVGAQPFARFKQVIDAALAGKKAPAPAPQAPPKPRGPVKIPVGSSPSFGPANAKVTVVEFSDFECPFCNRGAKVVDQIKKEYGNKVRVVFKNLPLSFHRNAHLAAQASLAAHAQGKFWPFHDKLFANYRNLNKANFLKWAKELGLDMTKFKAALDNGTYKKAVDADAALASRVGANGTPTFFINGSSLVGAQPFPRFKAMIDAALAGKPMPTRAARPQAPPKPRGPVKIPLGASPSFGPTNAKVTIVEFSDFECPFCNRGAKTIEQVKKEYGNKVRVVFKNLPLPFHKNAHLAAQASLAAHAQGKFWPFHDKLFANYRSLNKANFLKWAKELGLDMAKFKAALDNGTYKKAVDADAALASRVGADGTPTFFINGRSLVGAQPFARFKQAIDAALAGKPIPAPAPQAPPKPRGPVKIKLGSSPSFGPANAKVTIVEFSDFECPFCNRGAKVVDQIKKEYGNKVRVVFKNLPLPFHRNAHLAAQASLAAHAQGKFWPFHDKLFANYRSLNKANFLKWAKELGLDMAKFKAALDNGTYKKAVDADAAQASRVGANGTPTFFINGRSLVGAQPFPRFKAMIDAELKK